MKIEEIHPLDIGIRNFKTIQNDLFKGISLKTIRTFNDIRLCAGLDVAYWQEEGSEWGVCSIVIIDYDIKTIVEKADSTGKIWNPYIQGYLVFRGLPLVIEAAKKLKITPNLFMFDVNGFLHPGHIGIAKSYLKIGGMDFKMPKNDAGSYEAITAGNEIYGRVLRTHKNVKPIFISCGNYIDLNITTEITLNLINEESRLPIPVRLADLETKRLKRQRTRLN